MKKTVILFNGPSSSGKSTLAKAFQEDMSKKKNLNFRVISIDDFLKMTLNDTLYEDDVFHISENLCKKGLELLECCNGLMIDHVITSERIFLPLKEMFSMYQMYLVHVTCPLDILIKREKERNNRCIGSAEASYKYLYPKEGYELTLDTYNMTTKKCLENLERMLT